MGNINKATQFGGENSGNMTKDAQRTEIRSPVKAIRAYCLNCGDGTAHEVRRCDRKNARFGRSGSAKTPICTARSARSRSRRRLSG